MQKNSKRPDPLRGITSLGVDEAIIKEILIKIAKKNMFKKEATVWSIYRSSSKPKLDMSKYCCELAFMILEGRGLLCRGEPIVKKSSREDTFFITTLGLKQVEEWLCRSGRPKISAESAEDEEEAEGKEG